MSLGPVELKKWLTDRGLIPSDEAMAIAALAISLEDWKRELKKSQKRQRSGATEEEDEGWPN